MTDFYDKYGSKFGSPVDFLLEIYIHLLDINFLDKAIDFTDFLFNITEKQKKSIINNINKYYTFDKNKAALKKYFDKEINLLTNPK